MAVVAVQKAPDFGGHIGISFMVYHLSFVLGLWKFVYMLSGGEWSNWLFQEQSWLHSVGEWSNWLFQEQSWLHSVGEWSNWLFQEQSWLHSVGETGESWQLTACSHFHVTSVCVRKPGYIWGKPSLRALECEACKIGIGAQVGTRFYCLFCLWQDWYIQRSLQRYTVWLCGEHLWALDKPTSALRYTLNLSMLLYSKNCVNRRKCK